MSKALFIYLFYYIGMGLIFLLGMVYCAKQKDIGFSSKAKIKNLFWLIGGLVFYMVLHGVFQFILV